MRERVTGRVHPGPGLVYDRLSSSSTAAAQMRVGGLHGPLVVAELTVEECRAHCERGPRRIA